MRVWKRYELRGVEFITDWYGVDRGMNLVVHTGEEGLKRVREEPLRDYAGFGAQSVDYVSFEVVEVVEVLSDDVFISVEKKVGRIESGNKPSDEYLEKAYAFEPYDFYIDDYKGVEVKDVVDVLFDLKELLEDLIFNA